MKMSLMSLSIGVLLIFFSLQDVIIKNFLFDVEMNRKYKITELNAMYKGIPTNYTFGGKTINTGHKLLDKPSFLDPWDDINFIGDIFITVDGEKVATLKSFPVQMTQGEQWAEGLNQYGSFVSYWLIQDKQTQEEMFAVVLQTTREIMKNNNDIIDNEEQEYKMITISEEGNVNTEIFSFENKSKLQTKLLPRMDEGAVGYYSSKIDFPIGIDFLYLVYSPFFYPYIYPLLYPFFTLISGILLTLISTYIIMKRLGDRYLVPN